MSPRPARPTNFFPRFTSGIKRDPKTGVRMGSVYFILAERARAIKIGFSERPEERLADLQSAAPERLKLLAQFRGSFVDEQALHKRFSHLRLQGEWFDAAPELLAFIQKAPL